MTQELKELEDAIEKLAQTRSHGPRGVLPATAPTPSAQAPGSRHHIPDSSAPSVDKSPAPNAKSDVWAMQSKIKDIIPTFHVDGGWGRLTNGALNKIISDTQDRLELITELKAEGVPFDFDTYNMKSLAALKTFIPELKSNKPVLSEEDKSTYAQTIAKHLTAIQALNEQFNRQIASRGQFRDLLNNNKPLEQYSSPHQLLVSKEDHNQIETTVNRILSNPDNFSNVPVKIAPPGKRTADGKQLVIDRMPVIALTDKQHYLDWAKQQGFEGDAALNLFHSVIKPQLDKPQAKAT